MKIQIRNKDIPVVVFSMLFEVLFILMASKTIILPPTTTYYISYLYAVYFFAVIISSKNIKWLTAGMMVVYYTFILGAGIPFAHIFAPEYTNVQLSRSLYYHGQYLSQYISLCFLSTTTILIALIIFGNEMEYSSMQDDDVESVYQKSFYYVGLAALVFFAFYIFFNYARGNIVFGDYAAYKDWAGNGIRNYSQMAFWISSVFICSCGNKKNIAIGLFVYLIPASIMFLAGNRNDVLFPLLIGIGLYFLRYHEIPKKLILGMILVVLLGGPLIVQLRRGFTVEFSSIFSDIGQSLGESFFELGGQLHSVSNMFSWLESGEGYAFGATYLLGFFSSLLGSFVPSITQYYQSTRFYLPPRIKGLGFSMSAELYFNFSVIGVLLVYFFIGKFIAKREKKINNINSLLWYGFIMLLLLILARNTFNHSLVYLKIYIVMYLCARLLSSLLGAGKRGKAI